MTGLCNPLRESNASKRIKREKKLSTLEDWHGFKKKDLGEEDQQDMEGLKLRRYINAKSGGSKVDLINKNYMQLGTVLEDKLDGKRGKRDRKANGERFLDELKAEDEQYGFSKRKFQKIQTEKMQSGKTKRWAKMKKISKKSNKLIHEPKQISF